MIRIASIDPGQDTGLAIAHVIIGADQIVLRRHLIATIDAPSLVVGQLRSSRTRLIIMEQRPVRPSEPGLVSYEAIWNDLIRFGYRKSSSHLFPNGHNGTVMLFGPGVWKPFMKARKIGKADMGSWEPSTAHEMDALLLLYYAVRINYLHHQIIFE